MKKLILFLILILVLLVPAYAVFDLKYEVPGTETATYGDVYSDNVAYTLSITQKKLYKTINGGESWDLVNNSVPQPFTYIDFFSENIGIFGSTTEATTTLETTSIYKTIDGGKSFSLIPLPVARTTTIKFLNQNVGYFGVASPALFKTPDCGISWEYSIISPEVQVVLSIYPADEENVFVATAWDGGEGSRPRIFRTTNGGASWEMSTTLFSTSELISWLVGYRPVFFKSESALYLLSRGVPLYSSAKLYKSTDDGKTFSLIYENSSSYLHTLYFDNDSIGWLGGTSFVGSEFVLKRTLNGGASFEDVLPEILSDKSGAVVKLKGQSHSSKVFAFINNATDIKGNVLLNEAPSVSLVSPATIEVGATEIIHVSGSNFETTATLESLSSALVVLSAPVVSSTEIFATIEASAYAVPRASAFKIYNPDGSVGSFEVTIYKTPGSVSITSISPSRINAGSSARAIVLGTGFSTSATFEAASGISLESLYIPSSVEARLTVYASKDATGNKAISIINPDGGTDSINIEVLPEESVEGTIVPKYNNPDGSSTWTPERGVMKLYIDNLPTEGVGDLVVGGAQGTFKLPIDFSTTNGVIVLDKSMSPVGWANGVYPVRIYDKNKKLLAKTKVAIKR